METNKYTFTFKKSLSQKVYVEDITAENLGKDASGNSSLFFVDEYNQVINIITELVESKEDEKVKNKKYENSNNLILFTGQRGSGKTSAIKSISEYLNNNGCKGEFFYCLPMVDPSYFNKESNIIQTVLSLMFDEVKNIMKTQGEDGNKVGYEKILKGFSTVYSALGKLESSGESHFTLEGLNESSEASEMKKKMQDLVNTFISILPRKNNPVSKLLLVIDDVDMNVSYAAEMLEQIRKFLMLDNLIVLMSANLDQLQNEMCEYYGGSYKSSLSGGNESLSTDVEDQATKYLLKIFPTSRRVHVENPAERLIETCLIINDNGIEERKGPLQNLILTMIWEKTRLLFVPKDAEKDLGTNRILHPIIPTNLRELSHFLEMLVKLPDIPKSKNPTEKKLFPVIEAYDQCKENFYAFRNYILKNWIPNRLSAEEEQVFANIPSDITEINKHLINSINVIGTKHKKRLMSREVDLEIIARNAEDVKIDRDIYTMVSPNDPRFVKANKISDIFNQPSNYSYGDLLLMIDKYETYFESDEDRRFTNAIKIYYSMLLFETMYFNSSDVVYNFDKAESNNILHHIIPIQKLIGGTMYYPNYFEIITSKYFTQRGPSFDAKRAFYHKMELKEDEKPLECPLFSVLYYGDVRPDRYDMKHIYDTTFEEDSDIDGQKYATFDILSVLNNMLNPWQTIMRSCGMPTEMGKKEKDKKKWLLEIESEWGKRLEKWVVGCKVDKIAFPNSILPFYSVDLMLCYLRNSVPVSEIIGSEEDFKEVKKRAYDYCNDLLKKDFPYLNKGDEDQKKMCEALEDYYEVLQEAHEYYKKYSFGDLSEYRSRDVVECYRNYIIALVLANYKGSAKDRDALVKELHNYQSVSEIFMFLSKKLCRDLIMEKYVRWEIQKKVHSKDPVPIEMEIDNKTNTENSQTTESETKTTEKKTDNRTAIERYYDKLWMTTKASIKNISKGLSSSNGGNWVNDSDEIIVGVYEDIYSVAETVFIQQK